MIVIKVIVDELPKSCLYCRFLDMVYGDECPINDRVIPDINIRPDWCPLVTVAQALRDCASPFAKWESEE